MVIEKRVNMDLPGGHAERPESRPATLRVLPVLEGDLVRPGRRRLFAPRFVGSS